MATVSEHAEALQERLRNIVGLNCYDVMPDQVTAPAAVVLMASGDYDGTFDGGYQIHAEVLLLAAPAQKGITAGYRLLDTYLAPGSERSVVDALDEGEYRVTGWRDRGLIEVGGMPYVGCRLLVEVLA